MTSMASGTVEPARQIQEGLPPPTQDGGSTAAPPLARRPPPRARAPRRSARRTRGSTPRHRPDAASTASSASGSKATRPANRGHDSTSASCSFAHDGGKCVSAAMTLGDVSSSISMICPSRPCPAPEVDHAAAAEQPPRAAGHFPGLVELFSRQAAGMADRPGNAVEQRFAGESPQVAIGEAALGRGGKRGQTNEKYSAAAM